jgi:homoserine kinase
MLGGASARPILVRVPATLGNLAGSDAGAALALDASMNVKVTPRTDRQVRVRYFGENGDSVPRDHSNLIVQAMRSALLARQKPFMGAVIEVYSSIPIGVGFGASAAAVWAGLIAANSLFDLCLDETLLFALGATLEARGDNLHAAWFGGLTVLSGIGETYRTAFVPDGLELAIVLPTIMKEEVRLRQDAFRGARHGATGRADSMLRAAAVEKFLAQGLSADSLGAEAEIPESLGVRVPGLDEALRVRTPGLLGTFACGSGPGVAIVNRNEFSESVEAVCHCFSRRGIQSRVLEVRCSALGARDWNSMYSLERKTRVEPLGAFAAASKDGHSLCLDGVLQETGTNQSVEALPR